MEQAFHKACSFALRSLTIFFRQYYRHKISSEYQFKISSYEALSTNIRFLFLPMNISPLLCSDLQISFSVTNHFIRPSSIFQYWSVFSRNSILVQKTNVHHHNRNSPLLDYILIQFTTVYTVIICFPEIFSMLSSVPSYCKRASTSKL